MGAGASDPMIVSAGARRSSTVGWAHSACERPSGRSRVLGFAANGRRAFGEPGADLFNHLRSGPLETGTWREPAFAVGRHERGDIHVVKEIAIAAVRPGLGMHTVGEDHVELVEFDMIVGKRGHASVN